MDDVTYDKGREIRTRVLGEAYVANAEANADEFSKPLQDLLTEYCWGAVWGRDGLPLKTRSMLNLAMISVLNRPHELKTHVKGAITNGVTREEIARSSYRSPFTPGHRQPSTASASRARHSTNSTRARGHGGHRTAETTSRAVNTGATSGLGRESARILAYGGPRVTTWG